jgi:hypothetical protein
LIHVQKSPSKKTAVIGGAMMTLSQGKVGSDSGRQRANALLLARHIATRSPQPPSFDRPMAVMTKEPNRMMAASSVPGSVGHLSQTQS